MPDDMEKFLGLSPAQALSQSRELRNEKKYTVRELLGSEEAMKDLLHERLLAVRDDLNFAINACNPNINLQNFLRQINAIRGEMQEIRASEAKFQRDVVDALGLIRQELQPQPRWWAKAKKWIEGRMRNE